MTAAAAKPAGAGPFSAFERLVAWRYLTGRTQGTVISVIASISYLGIMLGVATLIVVMAVMNGFRSELLTRILGINGHLIVQPIDTPLEDYAEVAARINGVAGVKYAIPLVDGQVLAQGNVGAGTGALVRGIRGDDLAKLRWWPATSSKDRSSASTAAKVWRSASAWPTAWGCCSAT